MSPRFEPALAGVAETYQQQGNKSKRSRRWQRYLDAYPGSAKATKQLQILGAGATPTPPDAARTPTPHTDSRGTRAGLPAPTPSPRPANCETPCYDGSAS